MANDRTPSDKTSPGNKTCWVSHRLVTHPDRWLAVVCIDETINTVELPGGEPLSIGRATTNQICIEHPSVSRLHAVLTLGDEITVVDEGSTNGTSVAGRALAPHTPVKVNLGEAIAVGSVMVIVQRLSSQRARTILSHDYFEARLQEECAKRARTGGTFGVLRLNAGRSVPTDKVEAILHRALRAQDVTALYAPGEYEVLVDAGEHEQGSIQTRIRQLFAEESIVVTIGSAAYPRDGVTPDDLILCANESVRSKASGRETQAHVPDSWMAGMRDLVTRVARSELSVLILGETGAGKERMAEAVHRLSRRADKTFLRINCAALTESLVESELFGHERGAFTGAMAAKQGLIESAHGGTLFLDEVGELSLSIQVKLLRVVEERKVMRVGARVARPIDVRFVSATNRDLESELLRGTFRQDLFFRLNGVTLVVPPLRERRHEIARLARMFAEQASPSPGRAPEITPEALETLEAYDWPGNVRELRNVIERAVLLSDAGPIQPRHLPAGRMGATRAAHGEPLVHRALPSRPRIVSSPDLPVDPVAATGAWPALKPTTPASADAGPASLRDEIDALERQRILDALERCAGNQTKAAQMLGMSRGTLVSRLAQYNVPRPRKT